VAEDYLENVQRLTFSLVDKMKVLCGPTIPSIGSKYTGVGEVMGFGDYFNTAIAGHNLTFAMAMTQHPLLYEIVEDGSISHENFPFDRLVEARILEGYKVLDLGCGKKPTFARVIRQLGAETWTIDMLEARQFSRSGFDPRQKAIEEEYHIVLDINDQNAIDRVVDRTGNDLDLVAVAILSTVPGEGMRYFSPYEEKIRKLAMSVLKIGGVYLHDTSWLNGAELKP